ncbi:MAG: GNAT family N-acetyltransferase [Calditrichia bacterium]
MSDTNIFPLTTARWSDFETLFGERGGCGGCWCMWWYLRHSDFERQKGAANREAMQQMVLSGRVPGLLAYRDGGPVGWCALGPREIYPRLARSRILQPVDDQPVWSVVCFFIPRRFRRQGLSLALLKGAVDYARQNGARIVEGYPVAPRQEKAPDAFVWTGLEHTFLRAGFREVARRSPTRPIYRYFSETETGTPP